MCHKTKIISHLIRHKLTDRYVIVASDRDPAGMAMINYLLSNFEFTSEGKKDAGESYRSGRNKNVQLYVSSESLLNLENLDDLYPHPVGFIFLSKHKSESRIPTLTCHCTGNFDVDNSHGGRPREIAISYPSLQKEYLKAIFASHQKVPHYDIILEATHHGPTSLRKPVLFIELGSSEKQWVDKNAAKVICDTLFELLDNGIDSCDNVGIALGGTHYPIKFNKLLIESKFGLAAVASKHNLSAIDDGMLKQMIEKSMEKVTHIILDSKGLGSQKGRIIKLAESTKLELYQV
jgi:D-aminoacyl-tRNA deacylase